MRRWVAFKKHVNKLLLLLTHGSQVVKQKLFVNVNQPMTCKTEILLIDSLQHSFCREELQRQAKRKGLTTCLIRDAGM